MILSGQLLLCGDDGRCRIEPGFVRLDGERIIECVPGKIPRSSDVGGKFTLICPGFIDAHLHLPQFDLIGAHGLPLLRWLNEVTFPAELKWSDSDFAAAMTQRALRQLLASGTTGIGAYATVHHESAKAALKIAAEMGIRGVIGQVLMDRESPPSLCRPRAQLIDETEKLLRAYPAGGRLSAAVTPRFAITCSDALLASAGELATAAGATVQTHIAETVEECARIAELFPGQSYVDVYRSANLLGARTILGHGIHLDSSDRSQLRETDAVIAHCPTANSFLRSGTMNRQTLVDEGVRVALGSDIGAGYERSMVRVARAMIEAASSLGRMFPDAASAWYSMTAGNAALLGWDDGGRIDVGCSADLLVIEPSIPWLAGGADPLALLLFGWDDRWLKKTMLRGQFVWERD